MRTTETQSHRETSSLQEQSKPGSLKLSHLCTTAFHVLFSLCGCASVVHSQTIDRDLLAGIEDGAPVRNAAENAYESRAYNYLLVQARKTSPEVLARLARKDLTFAHLFEEASKHRGEVVHVEGQLRRLRKFDAPPLPAKEGVPILYEGWVFGDTSFGNPYCVVISEVPVQIEPSEKLDLRVACDAYFFKRYRYKAGDGWRDAPLLIGRTLSLTVQPEAAGGRESDFSDVLFPMLFGLAALTLGLCVGLTWWFRRADRRIRTRLEAIRTSRIDGLTTPRHNSEPVNGSTPDAPP